MSPEPETVFPRNVTIFSIFLVKGLYDLHTAHFNFLSNYITWAQIPNADKWSAHYSFL